MTNDIISETLWLFSVRNVDNVLRGPPIADKCHALEVHRLAGFLKTPCDNFCNSGCLSTVQCGELGKTGVVGGIVVRRPSCIGGRTHTLPHGAGNL